MNHSFDGKQLLAELGISPVYVVSYTDSSYLSDRERQYLLSYDNDCTVAFTSPTCDLMFRNGALRYDWQGRGFCCVFVEPPEFLGPTATLGVMLHEAGHHLASCDDPTRDDCDYGRAVKSAWQAMKPNAQHHDRRWLRATVHLWHRATAVLGYEIPFEQTIVLERYGFSRHDLAPLLAEASQRENEPIETILGKSAPGMMASHTPGTATTSKSIWPMIEMAAGHVVQIFQDGHVETAPDLYGRQPSKRFNSMREFYNSLDKVA